MVTLHELYAQIPAMQAFAGNMGLPVPNEELMTRQILQGAQNNHAHSQQEKVEIGVIFIVLGVVVYGIFIRKRGV